MGENKKYYWLKLQHDFFRQPRIKKLRKIAGGDTYTIIYLELQLLSLSNNGVLVFEGIEDDFIEELALTLDEDVDNVRMTVMYLMKHGLIEEVKPDEFALIETMQNIGSETQVATRVRKHRERQKALQCNTTVTICNTEKEIEKEKEEDIDIEVEEEKKKKETFVSLIADYTDNPRLVSVLKDYVEMRKKQKGFTTRALKLNLNQLDKLEHEDVYKIAVVEQSIMNSWKAFYPLKNNEIKNEHIESLRQQYVIYSNAGMIDEMVKIRNLYYDLTNKDIEDDMGVF